MLAVYALQRWHTKVGTGLVLVVIAATAQGAIVLLTLASVDWHLPDRMP